MNLHKILLRGVTAFSAVMPLSAQTLTPSEVAVKILETSPATRADKLGLASLSESLKTESNLPDPEMEGEYLFAPGDEKNRWGAGVTWGIEWPGVYSARREEAMGKLTAAETAMDGERHLRLIEIKRRLLDYVLAEKKLAVLGEIGAANDSIMALSQKAERHGELTRLDMNKLRLEQASLRSAILAARDAREEAVAWLNVAYCNDCSPLLEMMACELPEIIVPADFDTAQSSSVAAARAEAEAAKRGLKVAKAEGYPSLSIGYQHAFEDGIHFNGASVGISVPLFSSRGKKAAAKAAIAEAEFKAEKAAAEAGMETEASRRRLAILAQQIEEMSAVINDADNVGLLMKAYRGGVITLVDFLNERNYFTNAALDLLSRRHAAANLLLDLDTHRR